VWFRVVVAVACCGCGGSLQPRPAGGAPDAAQLAAIRIEGNHAIASQALVPALALADVASAGGTVDPYLLELDGDRIRTAYLKRGFFEAQVAARIEPGARGQTVVYAVREGRQATAQIEIAGAPTELAPGRARALVALRDGAVFDYAVYDAAKPLLRALVANAGYAHAEVRANVVVDPVTAIAHARYDLVPGARCTFGAIRVRGTTRDDLVAAIRARVGFAPGDGYSMTALQDAQVAIYEVGRFATVQLIPALAGDATTIDVEIDVAEADRHEVHGGFGFGYEPATYELRTRGGFSVVPAARPLLTLATDAQVAYTVLHDFGDRQPKIRAIASAQYQDLWKPRLRGELEVGADYQTVEAYSWIGGHVRLGLASPLGARWLQLRVGWVLEHLTFQDLNDAVTEPQLPGQCVIAPSCEPPVHALGLDRTQLRGAYEASLVADLRDSAIDPHRGIYFALPVSDGTPLAGGQLTYLEVTPELRGYLPIGHTVVAARARFGGIFGDVPVTERYYSGGTTGQRGYSERRLSPIATGISLSTGEVDSVVIGGAGLIETGVELRRPIGTLGGVPLGGNLFLDGGDVTLTVDQLDPAHLAWAAGAGVWTQLGGLKIRFDVGYRLNRQSTDTDVFANVAPHLGIGEAY
jgi:outer membrane protein assembly factor BamA